MLCVQVVLLPGSLAVQLSKWIWENLTLSLRLGIFEVHTTMSVVIRVTFSLSHTPVTHLVPYQSERYEVHIGRSAYILAFRLIEQMGQQPVKKKQMSLQDSVLEMKMQMRQLERSAKKAEKEQKMYQKKAKEALKKNNEEGAKMYLMSAAQKNREALTCEKTAIKMGLMSDKIRSMKSNEQLMKQFSNMAGMVSQQMEQFDAGKMMNNMQMFNDKMDEMMINGKMMEEIMAPQSMDADSTVEAMLANLQQQIALEDQTKLLEAGQLNAPQAQQKNDPFLDQLKGL